ncbi:MAG TPA: hypothetical protein VFN13_06070 [Rudaea sp.]|nr:hypothetical protein [Rudaea sp.]
MPMLKSGRHVALSASPYVDLLKSQYSDDNRIYFTIVAIRLNIPSSEQLRDHLVVGYFRPEGEPPNAPSYYSGYCVADIFSGRSDWSQDEIEEFGAWIESDERFEPWLVAQFDEINAAIQESFIWNSPLLADDDVALVKRRLIEKAALEPASMEQIRSLIPRPNLC